MESYVFLSRYLSRNDGVVDVAGGGMTALLSFFRLTWGKILSSSAELWI